MKMSQNVLSVAVVIGLLRVKCKYIIHVYLGQKCFISCFTGFFFQIKVLCVCVGGGTKKRAVKMTS